MEWIKKQPPGRMISLGFAIVILLGALLLWAPFSVREDAEVSFLNALFTSTSAVCVTGLIAIDTADHFTPVGQAIVALLIQVGGLGVTSVGAGLILATGKRMGIRGRLLVKEALNVNSYKGIVRLIKAILLMTLCFEAVGAFLSFLVFSRDFSYPKAIGVSVFHAIAAFNNSGFDNLGGLRNLIPYQKSILLNLTTCGLIFFGGIGFLVILDIGKNRRFKKLTLHSKVVLTTSAALIAAGTCLLKLTEDISWMGAFFHSISARTAGFSTYSIGEFTDAGLFVLIILMFIGASPGSTGGGIKTSTFFVMLQAARSMFSKKPLGAFRRGISKENVFNAYTIMGLSLCVVCIGTFLMAVLEPEYGFLPLLFEVVSAFGTVGLSTGITPELGTAGKIVIILIMYTGRLGAVTLLSMWIHKPESNARYTEETITIG